MFRLFSRFAHTLCSMHEWDCLFHVDSEPSLQTSFLEGHSTFCCKFSRFLFSWYDAVANMWSGFLILHAQVILVALQNVESRDHAPINTHTKIPMLGWHKQTLLHLHHFSLFPIESGGRASNTDGNPPFRSRLLAYQYISPCTLPWDVLFHQTYNNNQLWEETCHLPFSSSSVPYIFPDGKVALALKMLHQIALLTFSMHPTAREPLQQ